MKPLLRTTAVLAIPTLALLFLGAEWRGSKNTMIVVQREAVIRARKRNYARRVAVVREGAEVAILGTQRPWHYVEWRGKRGWLHSSAVTANRAVVLSGEVVASGTRATEQSAGRRGFTPGVEGMHRGHRPDLGTAYDLVDEIEGWSYPEEILVKFLTSGRLADFATGGN